MSDDKMYETETWVYLGRFWDSKNGFVHRWRTGEAGDAGTVAYKKLSATVVGGLYEVQVHRDDANGVSAQRDVVFTERCVLDHERAILLALVDDNNRDKRRIDAEKRFNSTTPLDRAMSEIEAMARNCRTIDEMDALVAVTRSRIIKAWRDR